MTTGNLAELSPTIDQLGANKFTFTGDRTTITFFPRTPGPLVLGHEGGEFNYAGPEGTFTVFGQDITRSATPLGCQLTITLRPDADAGQINITVLLPKIFGVTAAAPLTFGTLAVRTTGRGFTDNPGSALTYDVLPLVGQAEDVVLPL